MLIGAFIGLSGLRLSEDILSPIRVAGDCMSPVAMLLTGITVASCDLGKVLKQKEIYLATMLRLILFPAAVIAVFSLVRTAFSLGESAFFTTFATLAVCAMTMPVGLNTVVIPIVFSVMEIFF